ncbi:MAG: hypothetical protein QOF01_5108 [Thermomicrobiales bacterium]|nr:hypothetical protein [Thermomicrobiales bacterium]
MIGWNLCHVTTDRIRARPVDRVALFADAAQGARPLTPRPFASVTDLRRFTGWRPSAALGPTLVASEVLLDGWEAERIEALAVDERMRPHVVEFKREASSSAIDQALAYVDWLFAHRDAVTLHVARRLGVARADPMLDPPLKTMVKPPFQLGQPEAHGLCEATDGGTLLQHSERRLKPHLMVRAFAGRRQSIATSNAFTATRQVLPPIRRAPRLALEGHP